MNNSITKIPIFFLLLILSIQSFAIDPHFSQYYAYSANINPAMTGVSYGKFKFSGIYRNQWLNIPPIQTYSLTYEMSFLESSFKSGDFMGFGINAFKDGSKNGVQDLRIMSNLSYHKAIGANSKNYLAIGFQGGIVQKSFNIASSTSQNQWVPLSGYDNTLTNGETSSNSSFINIDFQAGIFWYSFLGKKSSLFLGASIYHLSEPEQNFFTISSPSDILNRRLNIHGGTRIGISEKVNFVPNAIFMQQAGATELAFGNSIEYSISKSKEEYKLISLGMWYRLKDAISIIGQLEYKNFLVGLAYDLNTSSLKSASNSFGAFEITMSYMINKPKGKKKSQTFSSDPYPRM